MFRRLADDIDLMGCTSSELQDLTKSLFERAGNYRMEKSENHGLWPAGISPVQTSPWTARSDQNPVLRSSPVWIWIAMATSTLAALSRLWTFSSIRFPTKYRFYKSLRLPLSLHPNEQLPDLDASFGHRTQAVLQLGLNLRALCRAIKRPCPAIKRPRPAISRCHPALSRKRPCGLTLHLAMPSLKI